VYLVLSFDKSSPWPIDIHGPKTTFYRNIFLSKYCAWKCLAWIGPKHDPLPNPTFFCKWTIALFLLLSFTIVKKIVFFMFITNVLSTLRARIWEWIQLSLVGLAPGTLHEQKVPCYISPCISLRIKHYFQLQDQKIPPWASIRCKKYMCIWIILTMKNT